MNQMEKISKEKIYIIILNYNSAVDTMECLESLKDIELMDDAQIILVDNKSTNDSVVAIEKFLQKNFKDHVVCKKHKDTLINIYGKDNGTNIVFIENDENEGFSAGNNVALEYACKKNDGMYFWFLNNDTVQDRYSLSEMIKFMKNESLVLTSSVIYDYIAPRRIQAIGIALNRPIYNMPIIGRTEGLIDNDENNKIKSLSYTDVVSRYPNIFALVGASFLLNKTGLELIGGKLDESYKFYFEEADIARKIKGKARYAPCLSSVVWHKGGGSTKSKGSYFIAYHMARSQMIFIKRYAPKDLPIAVMFIGMKVMFYCLKGRLKEAFGMISGLIKGLWYKNY